MKRINADKFAVLFWLLAIADVAGIYTHIISIHFLAKPLLIPALIAWLCLSNTNAKGKNIILTGLVFSFLGDVFLLFENLNPIFFITGLASFLITHICYIIFFLRIKTVAVSLLKKQPLIVPIILCYGACLIWLLFPHLGKLKIPVIVYGLTICTMLICSLHIFLSVSVPSNKYYFGGAALLVTGFLITGFLV